MPASMRLLRHSVTDGKTRRRQGEQSAAPLDEAASGNVQSEEFLAKVSHLTRSSGVSMMRS
jgi:hypothetical protein